MTRTRAEKCVPAVLAAGCFALAFAQRPGLATADTKINLHVSPGAFLHQVASMWTSTGQLGDVQAGQQAGYMFPMGRSSRSATRSASATGSCSGCGSGRCSP